MTKSKEEQDYDNFVASLKRPAQDPIHKLKKLTEELSKSQEQKEYEKRQLEQRDLRERQQRERYEQEKRKEIERRERENEEFKTQKSFYQPAFNTIPIGIKTKEIITLPKKSEEKQNNPWVTVAIVALIVILLSAGAITYGNMKKLPMSINNSCQQCQACPSCPSAPACPVNTCTCSPVLSGSNFSCIPVTNIYTNNATNSS